VPLLFEPLGAGAQTLFANVEQASRSAQLRRTIADLPGGLTTKVVKGRRYVYYQARRPDGTLRQIYLGPDGEVTAALVQAARDPVHQSGLANLAGLTRAAIEAGCAPVAVSHARVIRRLADHGFFAAGGILVGTHAFLAYQNMLGVRWVEAHVTSDIDFAHPGRNISIALARDFHIDTRSAIESLQMGFVPNADGTTFTKADETDFEIDFLTSRSRQGDAPQSIPELNLSLQPLRFMEFSMEQPLATVLLARAGPVVVNVPQPSRYALHKLMVASVRATQFRTKITKDLGQAAALVDWFAASEPDTLQSTAADLAGRGPAWRKALGDGVKALTLFFPPQAERLQSLLA
jgi:hypothetical protein